MLRIDCSCKRLYLIGARSSGKSTAGAMLAARLNWAFAETDVLAEENMGRPIFKVVEERGWDAFRDAEVLALKQASGLEPAVISTGGGIILRQENCELMSKTGVIIYLYASGDELARRLTRDVGARPSLTGELPAKEIVRVLEEREPIYRKLAHFIVDVHCSVEEVCDNILEIAATQWASGDCKTD